MVGRGAGAGPASDAAITARPPGRYASDGRMSGSTSAAGGARTLLHVQRLVDYEPLAARQIRALDKADGVLVRVASENPRDLLTAVKRRCLLRRVRAGDGMCRSRPCPSSVCDDVGPANSSEVKMRSLRTAAFLIGVTAVTVLLPATTSNAQVTTATLFGTVRDTSGAIVPGANITATNEGTGITRTSVTDDGGEFTLTALPAGAYTLRIELQGFKT